MMDEIAVWAPAADDVALVVDDATVSMRPRADGWFVADAALAHGQRYGFALDAGPVRADPRAVWLPDGVHAPGRHYDHARFDWTDAAWTGHSWAAAVLYELHVGTFTAAGTFDAAIERLGHLVDLGVTHVELLPVCAADGAYGWGYDGVAPWSVHEPYGGPDGLKRFVDAAHAQGLSVLLDVVHNHLGPSGNYLGDFGPYFTDRVTTPWGAAVNLDAPGSDEVRAYLIGSVEAWLRDFHLDGVRLDAVHELHDTRALTLLEELSARVAALSSELGRPLVAVAESDRNDPRTVLPRDQHGLGLTAQWDDDVHHALHVWLTGESQGYYEDFARDPSAAVATVWQRAFFHAGTYSTFRGRVHGRPVDLAEVPGWRFVASLQTHDQVGNRAHGERLTHLVRPGRLAGGAALLLLSPFVPMLFMGEEWGASTPWQFFSSFPDPDLAAAVTAGRQAEFADHGWSAGQVPDPQDRATLERSVLDWHERAEPEHARLLDWYRRLIELRGAHPELGSGGLDSSHIRVDGPLAIVRRGSFLVVAWLGDDEMRVEVPGASTVVASFVGPDNAAAVELHDVGSQPVVTLPRESTAVLRTAR
jgi:maltooligosyltrehalose trehalohydrolase